MEPFIVCQNHVSISRLSRSTKESGVEEDGFGFGQVTRRPADAVLAVQLLVASAWRASRLWNRSCDRQTANSPSRSKPSCAAGVAEYVVDGPGTVVGAAGLVAHQWVAPVGFRAVVVTSRTRWSLTEVDEPRERRRTAPGSW